MHTIRMKFVIEEDDGSVRQAVPAESVTKSDVTSIAQSVWNCLVGCPFDPAAIVRRMMYDALLYDQRDVSLQDQELQTLRVELSDCLAQYVERFNTVAAEPQETPTVADPCAGACFCPSCYTQGNGEDGDKHEGSFDGVIEAIKDGKVARDACTFCARVLPDESWEALVMQNLDPGNEDSDHFVMYRKDGFVSAEEAIELFRSIGALRYTVSHDATEQL